MKKISQLFFIFTFLLAMPAMALDPLAERSERDKGMIFVKTPLPSSDKVIATHLKTNESINIPIEQATWVPLGDYRVDVKLQGYQYSQNVTVQSTERTDVVVPGYGNLRVNPPSPDRMVQVFSKNGTKVAEFPCSTVKTLPTGVYDLKISVGKDLIPLNDIWIVTNTTREVDVKFESVESKKK